MRGSCLAAVLACAAVFALGDIGQAQTPRRGTTPPAGGTAAPAKIPELRPTLPSSRAGITSTISLSDLGFIDGFRFARLAGRRDVFLPLPEGSEATATELMLTLDDVTAHPARRSLEILLNDRTVASLALDGRSAGRVVSVPLPAARPQGGFAKLSFLYSGAATEDRCIDARYVGDALAIRGETTIQVELPAGKRDIASTVALLPRDVALVLSSHTLAETEIAAALTAARAVARSGRRVSFLRGARAIANLNKAGDGRRWSRGIIILGPADEFVGNLDEPRVMVAGPMPGFAALGAVSIGGFPALLISDPSAVGAGDLLDSPLLSATRGLSASTVGAMKRPMSADGQISFDQLGLTTGLLEVSSQAEASVAIHVRDLPAGTSLSRLLLDISVAPDDAGQRAVVSVFANGHLLGSTLAASGEPTRMDLPLPAAIAGTTAAIRTVVQRRPAQGDCHIEAPAYPAQILGSSAIVLAKAGAARDFSDLAAHWGSGLEILLPQDAAHDPLRHLPLLSSIVSLLTPRDAPIKVKLVAPDTAPAPQAPFIVVSGQEPRGSNPLVHFDQGRIAVIDRNGRTLLDLGGLDSGAVAQVVIADGRPGLWIRPLATSGTLPSPAELRMDRGDVAVLDDKGTALALSSERDTLVRIAYPERVSWATVAARFRPWVIGALWLLGTMLFLLVLPRIYRGKSGIGQA